MTYRELRTEIQKLDSIELDSDVTIYLPQDGEFYGVQDGLIFAGIENNTPSDILDEGHPFLHLA